MRILVVEDSKLVQRMYGLAFSPREHALVAAENGRAALTVLQGAADDFDLILLDLRMPDMNGVEFLREVQRLGVRTPVILTTAEPEHSTLLADARALKPAAIVHKPWKPTELRDVAATVTGQRIS